MPPRTLPPASTRAPEPPPYAQPKPALPVDETEIVPRAEVPEPAPPVAAAPAAARASAAPPRAPEPRLKPGAIEMVQQRLEAAGILPAQEASAEPGEMSASTRTALERFQRGSGLPATGELDEETVLKLGLQPRNIFFETTSDRSE
jgi:hypothetical protein